MPQLLSVNVGLPRDIAWRGETVHTGIWKEAIHGRRMVRRLNIGGDGQGDLAGHGGEQRAVFVYQIASYHYWEQQLGRLLVCSAILSPAQSGGVGHRRKTAMSNKPGRSKHKETQEQPPKWGDPISPERQAELQGYLVRWEAETRQPPCRHEIISREVGVIPAR
jgi:hypothetical protein